MADPEAGVLESTPSATEGGKPNFVISMKQTWANDGRLISFR